MNTIKVTILDDHIMILRGLKTMIDEVDNIRVYGTYCYGEDLLEFLKTKSPDIILMDIELPDCDGIELCLQVKKAYPEIKIIAISSHKETHYINQMLLNGANGYLLKNTDRKEIILAIKTVFKGGQYIGEDLKESIFNDSINNTVVKKVPKLTKRETQVFQYLSEGLTNIQIAEILKISDRTVGVFRQSLLHKFEVNNTAQLIKEGFLRGVLKNK